MQARRALAIYSRALDPGLWDAPPVMEALRRFATHRTGVQVQILLQDAAAPQHALAPLIGLAQRLPSVFGFREVQDPVDLPYAAAFVANDDHGYYYLPLGHRFDGEAGLEHAGRARQLRGGVHPDVGTRASRLRIPRARPLIAGPAARAACAFSPIRLRPLPGMGV